MSHYLLVPLTCDIASGRGRDDTVVGETWQGHAVGERGVGADGAVGVFPLTQPVLRAASVQARVETIPPHRFNAHGFSQFPMFWRTQETRSVQAPASDPAPIQAEGPRPTPLHGLACIPDTALGNRA